MTNKVFVYGTLKVGEHFSHSFDKVRKSSVNAVLNNHELYDFKTFPGIVEKEGEHVCGEIHEYDDFESVLTMLDYIEGYNPKDEDNSLYIRKIVNVHTENGNSEKAYVYMFKNLKTLFMSFPNAIKMKNNSWPEIHQLN